MPIELAGSCCPWVWQQHWRPWVLRRPPGRRKTAHDGGPPRQPCSRSRSSSSTSSCMRPETLPSPQQAFRPSMWLASSPHGRDGTGCACCSAWRPSGPSYSRSGSARRQPPRERPHDQSRVQHAGVLDRRQDLPPAETRRAEPTDRAPPDPAPARVPAPRPHVPGARGHLPGDPGGVHVSGGLRRSAGGRAGGRGHSGGGDQREKRPLPRVAVQRRGTLDLLNAIVLSTAYDAPAYMGPAYWIPAFWVPALLVTHYITFIVLWRHWPRSARSR